MAGRLASKVAIVTGASSGLGRAIALRYAKEGAKVVCSDLKPSAGAESLDKSAKATHETITERYPERRSSFVKCDVSNPEDVKNLIDQTISKYGRLDIMMNNAGVSFEARRNTWLRTHETDVNEYDASWKINARGVFLGCKYAAAQMLKQEPVFGQDRGWIVNMASALGLVGRAGSIGYVASKGAVVQMTKVVALEYAPDRIHCNAICPGFTRTGMISPLLAPEAAETLKAAAAYQPLGGIGDVDDVAKVAVFLASEDCAWVTGVPLPVDGGYVAH